MTDIAVVVLDTVRADAFADAFEWLPGTWYGNAFSTSHWTGAAHASLFTGQYPTEAAVTVADWTLDTETPVLAERLRAAGYDTRAFSANINVSPTYGYDRGFESFTGTWRLELPKDGVFNWFRHLEENRLPTPLAYAAGGYQTLVGDYDTRKSLRLGLRGLLREYDLRADDDGARRFQRFLSGVDAGADANASTAADTGAGPDSGAGIAADADRPLFVFANLMEAHQPYRVPEAYRSTRPCALPDVFEATFRNRTGATPTPDRTVAIDGDHARSAYEDCVEYLADVYRDAFETLRRRFDYVITLSDHGEAFGTDGVWEHGYGLYPGVTRIPLVVSGPGFDDRIEPTPVSILDVHRTVLELADGVDPAGRGTDLRDPDGGPYRTEYHGIAAMRRETLRGRGYADADIDAVDVDYRGIVADDGYGFESDDGWHRAGLTAEPAAGAVERHSDTPDDGTTLQSQLAALSEAVPDNRSAGGGDEKQVDDAVREQLADLGYR